MADRDAAIATFLGLHGWGAAERRPLAGDASFRRYDRLRRGTETAVLMDAPPPMEDVRPFVKIATHLRALGFSAPEVMAEDAEAGLLLLQDLGDQTYTRMLDASADAETLYALAVDTLIALHKLPAKQAIPAGLPPYGNGRLLDEAFLLPQWFMPAFGGGPMDEDARRAYGDAWLEVFPIVHAQPKTLVLRDFHVDNLVFLSAGEGIRACGLLDFQDALSGAPAYDLMSLLEDARRDVDPEIASVMLERYAEAFPAMDWMAFDDSYTVLAAQRHAKVIGIFTRLKVRDGKGDYLQHIPRVWRLLENALFNPVLAPVARWFDTYVPAEMRTVPPCP